MRSRSRRARDASTFMGPILLRDHAAATVAGLRAHSAPAPPKTARRVESEGGPVPPGLGQEPASSEVSADDLRLWAATDRGHTAAGLRHRRATDARAGALGQRGQRPLRAASPAGARVIAGVLAAPVAPPLGVSRPGRLGAPVPHLPPKDVQSGGAPEWPPQRGLHPCPAALLCDASAGTGSVAAGDSGTAWPQVPEVPPPATPISHPRPWMSCTPPLTSSWPISEHCGVRSCQRWRISCGVMAATTRTGLGTICCPAIGGPLWSGWRP
jgi:hypothetical protein